MTLPSLAAIGFSMLCLLPAPAALAQDDIRESMRGAMKKVEPVLKTAGELSLIGNVDEALQRILDTFPEKTRTPAQSLVLGNILYKEEPKLAYTLHKAAATAVPNEPHAQLEWAMEQHRAKEYAGALASYDTYLKAMPDHAPVWGVAAECLIRLGKTKEAVEYWMHSEMVQSGSIEDFETFV